MKGFLVLLAALLTLTGCGAWDDGDASAFAPGEEERLTIYTSHKAEVYGPIVREFEERTGIWVQVETGGTAELLERIAGEGEDTPCDLLFGGGVDSLSACADLFESYESPRAAALDPSYRCAGGSWTAFSVLPVVLIYNPVLVRMNPAQQRGRAQRLLRQPPGPGAPRLRGRGGRGGRGRLRHRRDPGGDCPQGRPGRQRHRHSLSRGGHQRPPRRWPGAPTGRTPGGSSTSPWGRTCSGFWPGSASAARSWGTPRRSSAS